MSRFKNLHNGARLVSALDHAALLPLVPLHARIFRELGLDELRASVGWTDLAPEGGKRPRLKLASLLSNAMK